jgi:reactive intermediate/imine deaminase
MSGPFFHMIADGPKPVAPYSHVVERDGWLFVTGQIANDPEDDTRPLPSGIDAQTRRVMDNLAHVLHGVGATLADVVTVRVFLTEFQRDYLPMNDLYLTYFAPGKLPARTTVGVTGLARDAIIEIDMIARRAAD